MEVTANVTLPDVLILTPRRYGDSRGWFAETWNSFAYRDAGIDMTFVQDNHSFSKEVGTLRGLHFQAPPHAQDKLVRCTQGSIVDIAVDVRRGSPTFGRWVKEVLSAENGKQFFVPKGFLHGFMTLKPDTEVQYKVSDYYNSKCDGSILWDSLNIDWNLKSEPILSDKDMDAIAFDNWVSPFTYETVS